MQPTEKLTPPVTEPLTWAEICERYPDQRLCLVEVEFVHPDGSAIRTARVIGHGKTLDEAIDQAQAIPWHEHYQEVTLESTRRMVAQPLRPQLVLDDETRDAFLDVDGDLIIIRAVMSGPRGQAVGRFVLDTGAAVTTMVPSIATEIGCGPDAAFKRTRVHTAIGAESGYAVRVGAFTALGFTVSTLAINVFALGHEDIDGLVGMNFLSDFNFEVRPAEQRILVERIIP
jgi:hypothetical protein